MIDSSLFKRIEASDRWFINQTVYGYEVHVGDDKGSPNEADIGTANYIIDNLDAISAKALSFLKHHLTMSGQYRLGGIEILREPDRHGAQTLLVYHNDEDGYLWIEAGLMDYRPIYALVKYY